MAEPTAKQMQEAINQAHAYLALHGEVASGNHWLSRLVSGMEALETEVAVTDEARRLLLEVADEKYEALETERDEQLKINGQLAKKFGFQWAKSQDLEAEITTLRDSLAAAEKQNKEHQGARKSLTDLAQKKHDRANRAEDQLAAAEKVVSLAREFSEPFTLDGKGIGNDMKRAVVTLDNTPKGVEA